MKDYLHQNEEPLLEEIASLKKQVAALEAKLDKSGDAVSYPSREPREPIETEITLIGDFAYFRAKSVNISESGICFDLNDPLMFEMKYKTDKDYIRRAKLLWMKKNSDDTFRLGMHFEE